MAYVSPVRLHVVRSSWPRFCPASTVLVRRGKAKHSCVTDGANAYTPQRKPPHAMSGFEPRLSLSPTVKRFSLFLVSPSCHLLCR